MLQIDLWLVLLDLVVLHIAHLENNDLLSYRDLWSVDTSGYAVLNRERSLVLITSQKSSRIGKWSGLFVSSSRCLNSNFCSKAQCYHGQHIVNVPRHPASYFIQLTNVWIWITKPCLLVTLLSKSVYPPWQKCLISLPTQLHECFLLRRSVCLTCNRSAHFITQGISRSSSER